MIEGLSASAVRSYDIRGAVPGEITPAGAHGLGLAYAAAARARGARRIGVAYDGRLSSPALETALVDGLAAGGMAVVRLGLGPTPMLGFALHRLGLDGGIMVTGSHNPPNENGFKLSFADGPVHGAALQALAAAPGGGAPDGSVDQSDVRAVYVAALAAAADGMEPLRVAWDCGHGAAGPMVKALAARLPGEHRVLFAEPDGRFPAHHPDPSVPANLEALAETVRRERCDIGLAFDGDGDRVGAVDSAGRIVWPDQLLLLLARELLARSPGATVLADVKSCRALFDGVRAAGGEARMAPAGYVRLRAAMLAADAPIAGEMSGHVFIRDRWIGTDDGLHAAVRVLAALGRLGTSLAAFRASLPPTIAGPEWRFAVDPERRGAVLGEVAARLAAEGAVIDCTDGLRVTCADGWWLLRASGTEPKLTARIEASDEAALARLQAALERQLELSGIDASCP
jgi:phosphomannomutase